MSIYCNSFREMSFLMDPKLYIFIQKHFQNFIAEFFDYDGTVEYQKQISTPILRSSSDLIAWFQLTVLSKASSLLFYWHKVTYSCNLIVLWRDLHNTRPYRLFARAQRDVIPFISALGLRPSV